MGDNPGRNEPGTGEINYRNAFRQIHSKGYTGMVGMEYGNSRKERDGERAVIEPYVATDSGGARGGPRPLLAAEQGAVNGIREAALTPGITEGSGS